jgi:hypothetical protein
MQEASLCICVKTEGAFSNAYLVPDETRRSTLSPEQNAQLPAVLLCSVRTSALMLDHPAQASFRVLLHDIVQAICANAGASIVSYDEQFLFADTPTAGNG